MEGVCMVHFQLCPFTTARGGRCSEGSGRVDTHVCDGCADRSRRVRPARFMDPFCPTPRSGPRKTSRQIDLCCPIDHRPPSQPTRVQPAPIRPIETVPSPLPNIIPTYIHVDIKHLPTLGHFLQLPDAAWLYGWTWFPLKKFHAFVAFVVNDRPLLFHVAYVCISAM
ncbi:hypothetical protein B0T21DRAFT_45921 [Apiosordaria backusii]|uniref:Uncharacterized protein n=1 Tax=Apiosordaria backusii TaxID=314023 RepID=A0AA40AXP7_9PEZI|nr:hypothetical protein B0T21DRAFT_45921 [Apiosordaria backusii]